MDASQQIAEWLRIFIEPGQVTELRGLDVSDNGRYPHTEAGYFDYEHLEEMAKAALRLTRSAVGIYFIPNPINPDLLARCANKVKQVQKDKQLTSDTDIVRRKWMLFDADPKRPDGISSTDEEKQLAFEVIERVKEYLDAKPFGKVAHVLADSGNGYHLLYRIDMEVEDAGRVQTAIQHVKSLFQTDRVIIDEKVFNPSRIVKLYGTMSRKGDHTESRPQRKSGVIQWWQSPET